YWNDPQATSEAIEDGWLKTGDIGRFDEAGFLYITDRKKSLVVTAGGKNIAPAPIESRLKSASPWISEVLLHGDRRHFCVALIELDFEAVARWAESTGLGVLSHKDLAAHPQVRAMVQEDVRNLNKELASFESIKDFALLPRPLSIETGERTPSLKLRRRVVEEHFSELLESFYTDQMQALAPEP
ncbi:MAG: long-chain acyl-CoA synthetase, partial [Cognaticolwellia sp.]